MNDGLKAFGVWLYLTLHQEFGASGIRIIDMVSGEIIDDLGWMRIQFKPAWCMSSFYLQLHKYVVYGDEVNWSV